MVQTVVQKYTDGVHPMSFRTSRHPGSTEVKNQYDLQVQKDGRSIS